MSAWEQPVALIFSTESKRRIVPPLREGIRWSHHDMHFWLTWTKRCGQERERKEKRRVKLKLSLGWCDTMTMMVRRRIMTDDR